MILKIDVAQAIDPNITQDDLNAFEAMVREITNNNFQKTNVRGYDLTLMEDTITINFGDTVGMMVGDTIEVNGTTYNDGLYVIKSLTLTSIVIETPTRPLTHESAKGAIVTLVLYPADIIKGVKGLIEYGVKMGDKVGIKSETISRMSVTYYDVNASDNAEGYPKAMLSFLDKYIKMRWR